MVFSYAKKAYDKVKSAIGLGSEDEFEEIDSSVDQVLEKEREIDEDLNSINRTYSEKAERAEEKFIPEDELEYELDSIRIDDPGVSLNDAHSFHSTIFGEDVDFIELESENLLDYVEELGYEIEAREDELQRSQEALEELGMGTTVGELLSRDNGMAADGGESYATSLVKSANVNGMIDQRRSELQSERQALQRELEDTVEKYTRQIYNEATELAEKLGGTERSEEGEFDRLRELADSRATLLGKAGNSRSVNDSQVLNESRRALLNQSNLVNQYIQKLDSYRDGLETLHEMSEDLVGETQAASVSERLDSMEKGLTGLKDVVNENDYESLQEALSDTVQNGLREGEARNKAFQFRNIDYSENEQNTAEAF